MPYPIRALTPADGEALRELDDYVFVADPDRAGGRRAVEQVDFTQAFGSHADDGRLVGDYVWFDLRVASPGTSGTCVARPVAGLSWVGVHPDHRRRGLLRSLIRHHLETLHERGATWSGLHASETGIYGRFGYAVASLDVEYTLSKGTTLAAPAATATAADDVAVHTLLRLDDDDLAARLAAVDDACAAAWPGTVTLSGAKARARLRDHPEDRRGREPMRALIATRDGADVGYALYSRTSDWNHGRPEGAVSVAHLQASDTATLLALGRRLVDMDLMSRVTLVGRGLDDPLLWWAGGPRGVDLDANDGLWLRPVDVGAALSERGYAAGCDVVLDVTDDTCPWNARRWRLRVGPDGVGACTPADTDPVDVPVVAVPVQAFGASHLGLRSFGALAAAGDVRVSAGDAAPALAHLDAAFACSSAPLGGVAF